MPRRDNVDWAEIKRRVDAAGRSLEQSGGSGAEESRRILEERARALAVPPAPPAPRDTLQLVTFAIDGEAYALAAVDVAEVSQLSNYALLPGQRGPVAGVTAWRGELLVVIDLASRARAEGVPAPWLVVVHVAERRFGLAADEIHGLVEVGQDALQPAAATAAPYIRAMTSEPLLVIDAEQLLELLR